MRMLESGRSGLHKVDSGSDLIPGLSNDVVVEHILPKIESLISESSSNMGLMDRFMALNAMTQKSKFWKSVMERTLAGIARWYETNPIPKVKVRRDCLVCNSGLDPDCYLYRLYNRYSRMDSWSIILSWI